jgi:hypothetical protein
LCNTHQLLACLLQETVLYVGAGRTLRALTLEGHALWTYRLATGNGTITVGPVIARPPSRMNEPPFVIFGTEDGTLHAVQAQVCVCESVCACVCYNQGHITLRVCVCVLQSGAHHT